MWQIPSALIQTRAFCGRQVGGKIFEKGLRTKERREGGGGEGEEAEKDKEGKGKTEEEEEEKEEEDEEEQKAA